jgi:hypothetical protein
VGTKKHNFLNKKTNGQLRNFLRNIAPMGPAQDLVFNQFWGVIIVEAKSLAKNIHGLRRIMTSLRKILSNLFYESS